MLIDNYQRQFRYLRLSITDVCNFKCSYCLPDGYGCDSERSFLTYDEIHHLLLAFAELGVSKVRITGGEPSLRKDLPDIIKLAKSIDGIETVALTTNGYKLTKHIGSWIDAGLDQLNVSIDSLSPSQFQLITGCDKLGEILSGLALAEELGFNNIKVNTVLLKRDNLNEFDQFLHWLKDNPVTLRFIELMETGDNQSFFNSQHISAQSLVENIEQQGWVRLIKSKDAGPANEYFHPEYQGKLGFIMPYSKDFCNSCNRLRVSATGNLHQCLFSEQGSNLRSMLQTVEQQTELKNWLQQQAGLKLKNHGLHQNNTGATKHLAMLGG